MLFRCKCQRGIEELIDTGKEVGPEVNRNKNMVMWCHQNSGQNYNLRIGKIYFENVLKLRCAND